jgi:glycosyltransferase involved in cell wall biosynthesis
MTQQRVAMIGPVPLHWGRGGRWWGGGVATHVAGVVSALEAFGVSVDLLAENATTLSGAATSRSARVVPVTHSWPRLVARGGRALPRMASRLLVPRRNGWRIPAGHGLRYLGLGANYRAFLRAVQPSLLHVHNARHAQFLCREVVSTDLPTVVTVHGVKTLLTPSPRWLRSMERENYGRADRLIAVSSFVRDRMIEVGAPADRITVIPNAVDGDEFRPADPEEARRRLGIERAGFTLLYTGNLTPLKGVDHLVAAFAQSGARQHGALVIVGDGPEKENLMRLAGELGIAEATVVVGPRPLPEMPLWYQASNAFVMPSMVEGLSMAVLEAMSTARPVITTLPEQGEHDVVEAGTTGILVPFGDVEGLAAAIDGLLRDREAARRMGHLARKLVLERCTWPEVARRTADVYREILVEHGHDADLRPQ